MSLQVKLKGSAPPPHIFLIRYRALGVVTLGLLCSLYILYTSTVATATNQIHFQTLVAPEGFQFSRNVTSPIVDIEQAPMQDAGQHSTSSSESGRNDMDSTESESSDMDGTGNGGKANYSGAASSSDEDNSATSASTEADTMQTEDLDVVIANETASNPIVIEMVTDQFFYTPNDLSTDVWTIPKCEHSPRDCVVVPHGSKLRTDDLVADARWVFGPMNQMILPPRLSPEQKLVMCSTESSAYYPRIYNDVHESHFDWYMDTRLDADIHMGYLGNVDGLFTPALPSSEKEDAVVYLNSNCRTKSPRREIMRTLIHEDLAPVHSYGRCDNNMHAGRIENKIELFHRYKICVAMENSIVDGYVTEKLFEALTAGCVPIVNGPSDIEHFLPDINAVVDYQKVGGTPEALAAEINRLLADPDAYEEKMAWKTKPREELNPLFLEYLERYPRRGLFEGGMCDLGSSMDAVIAQLGPSKAEVHRVIGMRQTGLGAGVVGFGITEATLAVQVGDAILAFRKGEGRIGRATDAVGGAVVAPAVVVSAARAANADIDTTAVALSVPVVRAATVVAALGAVGAYVSLTGSSELALAIIEAHFGEADPLAGTTAAFSVYLAGFLVSLAGSGGNSAGHANDGSESDSKEGLHDQGSCCWFFVFERCWGKVSLRVK
eukprot:Clim_evm8s10 gene=Clim_evmTU8s10